MSVDELVGCPAVLALELPGPAQAVRMCLDRGQAATLASLIADDLRSLLPDVQRARLAVAGAHLDSTELLRPQLPVFATLQELASRLHGEVVAFGAHDGRMPAQALQPDAALAGAALRLIPWTLLAPPALAAQLGQAMEVELIGRGEAGAHTADFLMRALGSPLQHARYLTRHDLMALTCVQYEHVNLAPLWSLLEAALLRPDGAEAVLSARGLQLRYRGGTVHAQTPTAWLTAQRSGDDALAHTLAGVIFELRQYVTLLSAHRVPLMFTHGEYDAAHGWLIETLAPPESSAGTPTLHAHHAPGLGMVALSVHQQRTPLAHAWLLGGNPVALCAHLAARFGTAAAVPESQPLAVDADRQVLLSGQPPST